MRKHSFLLLYMIREETDVEQVSVSWQAGKNQVSEVLLRETTKLFYSSGLAVLSGATCLEDQEGGYLYFSTSAS